MKNTNKRNNKKKNEKTPIPVIVAGLIIVAVVCIVYVVVNGMGPNNTVADQNRLFAMPDDSSAAIIINGEQIEEYGKVIDGNVYIPYDTVWDNINSGFYLENDTLYMTLPAETRTWSINDGSGAIYRDEAGITYISASCVKDNSDIEMEIYQEPARVVIRNDWTNVKLATVTEEMPIRLRADERSEIAVNVSEGNEVTLVEEGESWAQVISPDGHNGFIKSECLTDIRDAVHEADPAYVFEPIKYPDRIKMVWHYIDSVENNIYLDGMLADAHGLNIISPTWFSLSAPDGSIVSYADAQYVEKAHSQYGLSIWAMVGDYTGEDSSTGQILQNTDSRRNLINQIMQQVLTYGLEGINIDFETITYEEAPAYLQFLREITIEAHKNGIIVSVDNYVPTYTKQYKRSEENKIVDYVVIMGYDEHTVSSDEIGSVASIGFVENGIIDTLEEVDPEKTVLAVPFYSRGWKENYGSTEFEVENVYMTEQQDYIKEHGIEVYWNESVGQNMGSAEGENARYSIWLEDAQSIAKKLELVNKYQLAGASAWRIGMETPDIWDVWESYLG
jgi:spore germination protein YaaH